MGYQRAATIRRWSLTQTKEDETLGGGVVFTVNAWVQGIDRHWAQLPPTHLGLCVGGEWWVWKLPTAMTPIVTGERVELELAGTPEIQAQF